MVRDMQGRLIAREAIPVSTAPYTWLGADATGMPLPTGSYQLSLESRNGEQVLSTKRHGTLCQGPGSAELF